MKYIILSDVTKYKKILLIDPSKVAITSNKKIIINFIIYNTHASTLKCMNNFFIGLRDII